jgi:hypothetical protein
LDDTVRKLARIDEFSGVFEKTMNKTLESR